MEAALLGLIATIIAAIFGTFINEMYKRHRDAAATAAALAGELASYREAYALLDMSLPILISRVQSGQALNIPQQDAVPDVAFEAYVDKLGHLGSKLAEEVTYVYGQIRGFRSTFMSLTRDPSKFDAAYTESALRVAHMFTQNASRRGNPLIEALNKRASKPFWPPWK